MPRFRPTLFVLALLLVDCAQTNNAQVPSLAASAPGAGDRAAQTSSSPGPNLYVGNAGTVTVYGPGQTTPLRTLDKVGDVASLAFDADRNLYIAPADKKFVEVYTAGSSLQRRVTRGVDNPTDLAIDNLGRLYVDNYSVNCGVTVYAAGKNKLLRAQYQNFSQTLAVDSKSYLYVSHWYGDSGIGVQVYSPGGKEPAYEITERGSDPMAIGVDAHDHLYTTNYHEGTVSVYAPHGVSIVRRVTTSVAFPGVVTFDANGNVYCACDGGVVEYSPLLRKVVRTITDGIDNPYAMAVDASKNLYVANEGNNSVTVYAHGSTHVSETITDGVYYPQSLAFGP